MEHLYAIFKLLVNAVNLKHSRHEIRGLAISLEGACRRILREHGNKGTIRKNLNVIIRMTKTIEELVWINLGTENVKHRDTNLDVWPDRISRIKTRMFPRIQNRIKAVADELNFELKEVVT
jgi:hypothetical protein